MTARRHERHRAGGQEAAAQTFAHLAWKAGCREPRLAAYANLLAAPGDETALRRAADVCDEALLSRDGSTFDGWTELGAKRVQLLGRLERRRLRPSGELDEDGNPVPVRRHHPETPRRTRPPAVSRGLAGPRLRPPRGSGRTSRQAAGPSRRRQMRRAARHVACPAPAARRPR